jgi:hypothetical protein
MFGAVLADSFLALVHHLGDAGDERAAFGICDLGNLLRPWARRQRDEGGDAVPDTGVEDAGHVSCSDQVPFGDGSGQYLPGILAGQLSGVQGPPQPFRLMAEFAVVSRWHGLHEQLLVALLAGRGGLAGPDGVENGQVVGVR